MITLRTGLEIIAAIIASVTIWIFANRQPEKIISSPATAAPAIQNVQKVPVQVKTVQVYPASVKKKTDLPKSEQDNPIIAVLDSSKIQPDLHPQTITTILNTQTGETSTTIVQNPYPLFTEERRKEIRFSYGIKSTGTVGRIQFTDDLYQVKAIHLGFIGVADTDGEFFIGASAAYRW